MAVGAALANVGFMLSTSATVGAGDVGLLFGLRLYTLFLLRTLKFCALEGDAAHDGFSDFVVTHVAFDHIYSNNGGTDAHR